MDDTAARALIAMVVGLGLAFVVAMLFVALRVGRDEGTWRMRCLTCGRAAPLESVGGQRLAAASWKARTIVRCGRCGRLRWAALEKAAVGAERSD